MNTPVNFELAKLLKEKGYNEISYYIYISGEKNAIPTEMFKEAYNMYVSTNRQIDDYSLEYGFNGYLKGKEVLTAPTIAEVVMWLYEKHGFWITLGYLGENEFNFSIQNKAGWTKIAKGGFKLPTEAYEAAIEYTLKNLI